MIKVQAYLGPRDGSKSIWPSACPIAREKCRDGFVSCQWMHSRTVEDAHGNTQVLCGAPDSDTLRTIEEKKDK